MVRREIETSEEMKSLENHDCDVSSLSSKFDGISGTRQQSKHWSSVSFCARHNT